MGIRARQAWVEKQDFSKPVFFYRVGIVSRKWNCTRTDERRFKVSAEFRYGRNLLLYRRFLAVKSDRVMFIGGRSDTETGNDTATEYDEFEACAHSHI